MKTSNINRLSNLHLIGGLFLIFVLYGMPNQAIAKVSSIHVSFQVFYDELTPYGDWVNDPTHGHVWIPYVDAGFQPYQTNGYWVNSRFGNTWVSLYDWGWAPFHYGRWFYTDHYGWAWVPDYEWAPAWVSWRTGQGYYGWAPLWPSVGVHVSIGFPMHHWVFVPRRRFLARNIYQYYVPQRNVTVIYNRTTVINNTYVYNNRTYASGPSRNELQRVTRRNVPVYEVSNGRRPGRAQVENNRVQIYRPQLESANSRSNVQNERPARVYTADEYATRRASVSPSRSSVSPSRSSETANNRRKMDQSNRGSATLPGNTNPRLIEQTTRQELHPTSSGRSVEERPNQLPESSRNAGRISTTPQDVQISGDRRNSRTFTNSGDPSPNQRPRSVTATSPNNRQPATSNRISRGEGPKSTDRGTVSGQRQVNAPSQRNVVTTSPSRVRPQVAPSQRPVASPSKRQTNNTPKSTSRVSTNSPNQRQNVAPASRTQVSRPASAQSAPRMGSSSRSQNRSSGVQAPRQSRSNSGTVTRSSGNSNRRGN